MRTQKFTQGALLVSAIAVATAATPQPARADLFTWTDASGRVNISNIEPPEGVRARRTVQKALPKRVRDAEAARSAEVAALKERVAELESEVDREQQVSAAPPPAPVVVVAPVVVAPPPQPAAPSIAYAPPPDVAPCDPLMFGCPAFGYPVNVVVVRAPRFHRFRHAAHGERRPNVLPARPNLGLHRR